jgi:hypothetical protein
MVIDAHAHIFSHRCTKVSPPEYEDARFPVERLIEAMDRDGVSKAVIVQNPTIGTVNDEVRDAVGAHPDRFVGAIQVDPVDPQAATQIRQYARHPRQRVLKLEMSEEWGWSGVHPGIKLCGESMRSLWDTAAELGLRVIIDPGAIGNPGYQVEEIGALAETYSHLVFLLEHLGYMQKRDLQDARARSRRAELLRLALKPNVYLGFSAVSILLDEDFPCAGALGLLREAVDLAGTDKILWGTDLPMTLRRYSYRQMIDVVREGAEFLPEQDRLKILGGNAIRVFF